jgi:FKBP-type peptidyl-prolyl cis-trans isomerase FkpA
VAIVATKDTLKKLNQNHLLKQRLMLTKLLFSITLVLATLLSACGGGSDTPPAGPTQLQISDNLMGTGATAVAGNTLTVNYTGWLYDATAAQNRGKQFDTSTGRAPFSFKLGAGQVIAGWDQGMVGMKVGGKRTLIIPSALGYGSSSVGGGLIPPNSALVFDVELLAVQ